MFAEIPKVLWSMLLSSKRMQGRGWGAELIARLLRGLFTQSETRGTSWLRRQMDVAGSTVRTKVSDTVTEETIAGVRCLITEVSQLANSQPDTVVVYLHGGGFVVGSPQGFQNLISQLAHHSQALFIAVDYRLSPEHTFPAAQDDCLAVGQAVLDQYPNSKVVLAGDSAGGNLAISTALAIADLSSSQNAITGLLLISPWVEPTADSGSMLSNADTDILPKSFLDFGFQQHIGEADHYNPRVNFQNTNLATLPNTYVQAAGGELFVDQIESFCTRGKAQGVRLELKVFPTQFHDFQTLSPVLKDAKQAVLEMAEFIKSV